MYEDKDFDSIMEDMLASVSDKLDKREGSVIYDAIAPMAMELAQAYIDMDMILNEAYADTASYYYLIKRAAERGIYPKEETYAVCKMVVEPVYTPISIGDRFALGDLNYEVTSVVNAAAGIYQLTCETAGITGNQQLGDLLTIESRENLSDMESATITEILIPGEEEEDVEDFRERYFDSFTNIAFAGNIADYKAYVAGLNGVGACKIFRVWENGFDPVKFIPSSGIEEWIKKQSANTVGDEVYTWLTDIYNAANAKLFTVGGTVGMYIISSDYRAPSDSLVKFVQNEVDPDEHAGEGIGLAPIGHVVKVIGVKEIKINVNIKAVYKAGFTFNSLMGSIQNVIDDYLNELSVSWSNENNLVVRKSQIESRILLLDGVLDVTETLLNGKADNLTLNEDEIPVRGDVNG